ncbi:TonB-dependent receptor plug domain-containing protein [Hymenobacter tibetensis]|uniref:TonB-dependent receptor plug domain-containing protein n=1 Tax=Hymenobacter tibetensis TaxID=497967 RepID=A0ABY4CZ59_9BACT|nr:TonB-dependent receptor plug domain-containing protein [Hymenobacter tibetensis]UOG74460.1 TonB-dependent receptor plug domain-containing protein [Hymenobacter tibetensis]
MYRYRYSLVPLLLGFGLLLMAFQGPADTFIQQIIKQLERFYSGTYPEKSYLHFDKDTYAAGETMWFKAYVVEGATHQPDTLSRVLYVDLLAPNQRVVQQRVLQLQDGVAPGDFQLADTLLQGTYTVRAYTSWMRNAGPNYFFTRLLTVWSSAPTIARPSSRRPLATTPPASKGLDVQFFPEGGQFVAGLASIVGFKATDSFGMGVNVQGVVQDEAGQPVVEFSSQHLGMGRFQLKPEAGKRYTAIVRQPDGQRVRYELPAAHPTGFTMRVLQLAHTYQVAIQCKLPPNTPAEPITVVGHVRGQVVYAGRGEISENSTFSTSVPSDRFPGGVVHFTLFDSKQVARCERLAFNNNAPGLRISLQPDKASYGPREPVTVRVAVTDEAGKPATGNFSLAVNSAALVPLDSGATNIRTHLLLTSDLHGRVEQPGSYFRDQKPNTRQALDNLLLTQGWRRFVWKPLLAKQYGEFPYPLEQTLSLSGQVVGNKQAPAIGTKVSLFRFGSAQDITQATTDSAGRFLFAGFNGRDTARLLVQVSPQKGLRNPVIKLDRRVIPTSNTPTPPLPETAPARAPYLASSKRQQIVERQYSPNAKTIMLGNVTVKGKKPALPDSRRIYGRADVVVQTKDIPAANSYTNVLQLLQGRVAGVYVTGNPLDMNVQIRGQGTPLFLVDGIPIDISALNSIPVTEVESVEVLKGPSAAIYGSRGGGGVIAVFTKRGNPNYDSSNDEPAPGIQPYSVPQFYQVREFYAPTYANGKNAAVPDFRSATLYWNPTVRTDATGQATVLFYTSEEAGTFRLTLEGVSTSGQPGHGTGAVQVVNR